MRLKEVTWSDVSGGVVQKVSSNIALQNSVPFSMNLVYDDTIGQAVSRGGTDIVGSQLSSGNSCLGLYQHIDSTPANSILLAAFNGVIYNVATGASVVTGLSTSAKCRFMTFLNATLMSNGTDVRSYTNAGGWISTAGAFDLLNFPAGGKYPIEFKDRVYVAVTDQIHYTAAPSAGVCSWTAVGSGSLQAEQEDGGGTITGLNKVPGYLMIYKERSLKRWNFDSTFPEDLVNIGTQSNESIVYARSKNFFFYGADPESGSAGFYQTNGGYPTLISRPVQRLIDAIDPDYYQHVAGWSDGTHIYWSIGTITMDFGRGFEETYANVVLCYHIDMQQWAPLQYPTQYRFLNKYVISNKTLIVAGNTDGQVIQLNTGEDDYNGLGIRYILQSPEFDFANRKYFKTINDCIYVHSDMTEGAEIQKRLDYGEWESFGTLKDIVTKVVIKGDMTAHIFEFRIVDSVSNHSVALRSIDFPNVELHNQ